MLFVGFPRFSSALVGFPMVLLVFLGFARFLQVSHSFVLGGLGFCRVP